MARRWWMLAGVGVGIGCGGDPPPASLETGSTTAGTSSTGDDVSSIDVSTGIDASTSLDASTLTEPSTTGPSAGCGNGELEEGEECDGTDLGGATCESVGQLGGSLACSEQCMLDASGCTATGMVFVPGGEFEMGSDDSMEEQPIRQVNVDAFWIDETEVTVAEYTQCVRAGACAVPTVGMYYNYGILGRENHPINGVDWFSAEAYCAWEGGGGKRLPTEAEWEKAARGMDARTYPWGNAPGPSCTHVVMDEGGNGCGLESTWAVGQKPLGVSPYGALDMSGNIWEWVSDWYAPGYDPADTDNPTGPETGRYRIVRGGPWYSNNPEYFSATNRYDSVPTIADFTQGFRCAMTAP
jgi:formylglycine-generating enzyme